MSWQRAEKSDILRVFAACSIAVVAALCLRHLFLDNDPVRRLCDANANLWFCGPRAQMAFLLRHPAMGWGILAIGLLAIWKPTFLRITLALVIAGLGLVLYQASLASGAAALLLLRLGLADARRE